MQAVDPTKKALKKLEQLQDDLKRAKDKANAAKSQAAKQSAAKKVEKLQVNSLVCFALLPLQTRSIEPAAVRDIIVVLLVQESCIEALQELNKAFSR